MMKIIKRKFNHQCEQTLYETSISFFVNNGESYYEEMIKLLKNSHEEMLELFPHVVYTKDRGTEIVTQAKDDYIKYYKKNDGWQKK